MPRLDKNDYKQSVDREMIIAKDAFHRLDRSWNRADWNLSIAVVRSNAEHIRNCMNTILTTLPRQEEDRP